LNVLATVGEHEAAFRSLKDAWADTTTPHGRLMLTVLGGLAEFERELIRARTGEGRKRAKARGVKFGRPTALTPHQREEALQRLGNGEAQADVGRLRRHPPSPGAAVGGMYRTQLKEKRKEKNKDLEERKSSMYVIAASRLE